MPYANEFESTISLSIYLANIEHNRKENIILDTRYLTNFASNPYRPLTADNDNSPGL